MELNVRITGYGSEEISAKQRVHGLDDLEKISKQVATAVKKWLRQVPLRRSASRLTLNVYAEWIERGSKAAE